MGRRTQLPLPVGHPDRDKPRTLPDEVDHGTITAHHDYGCRCRPCRAVQADEQFARRLERSLAELRDTMGWEEWEVELERRARTVRRLSRAS